jgi:GTP cyclohydrolase II
MAPQGARAAKRGEGDGQHLYCAYMDKNSQLARAMFSYVDPTVKEELVSSGKLLALNERGEVVSLAQEEAFLNVVGPVPLPRVQADGVRRFSWYAWVRRADLDRIEQIVAQVRQSGPSQLLAALTEHMAVNSALVLGDFAAADTPLVRVHSNCLTGDVFHSLRCDCGPQLDAALEEIAKEGVGALIYMAGHEGRGIGLWAKAITYLLQDAGHDTYQANERLGLPADSRDFSDAARILKFLRRGKTKLRLLGNNPLKRQALEDAGFEVVTQEPLVAGVNPSNIRYLSSKRSHGHIIPLELLESSLHATPGDEDPES